MMFARRLAGLLLPMALAVCLTAPRGETQATNQDVRFAFADTTLLRDTLGLSFERLFPLADSLRMTPQALKQLSVTYRWTLSRLVKMADSLDVPIDSVGPVMERERTNPLANVVTNDQMIYTSTYVPSSSGDTWRNDLRYTVNRGRVFLQNDVEINQEQNGRGGSLGSKESRTANSSLNWRFSPRFSAGATANLTRYDELGRGGRVGEAERVNKFGFLVNARPAPKFGITPTLSLTGDVEDIDQLAQKKRGPSATLRTGLRYAAGGWWSNDVNLTATTKSLSAAPSDPNPSDDIEYPRARARDNSIALSGNLSAFRARPVEFSVNFQLSNNRTQNSIASGDSSLLIVSGPVGPETTLVVQPRTNKEQVRSQRRSIDSKLRFQQGDRRSLDLGWSAGVNENANSRLITSLNTREDQSLTASGRSEHGPLRIESTFSHREYVTLLPNRDFPRGGYREDGENRRADGKATWRVTSALRAEFEASISLNISRYRRIGSALTLPADNDSYEQQYKLTVAHTPSLRVSNTVGLQVTRSQRVNIPAASTASNSDGRRYRANWTWTYQLMEGLTSTQTNTLTADYSTYPFTPSSNRLQLDYSTFTTLNAVLNPRLNIDVTHQSKYQPGGNYRAQYPGDPTEYFSRADETESNSLRASIQYRPISAISLDVTPDYVFNARSSSQGGSLAPLRESRSLDIQGGASMNLPVGARGKLSGTVRRTVSTTRVVNFSSSGPRVEPRNERRTVGGSLTFTWTL